MIKAMNERKEEYYEKVEQIYSIGVNICHGSGNDGMWQLFNRG